MVVAGVSVFESTHSDARRERAHASGGKEIVVLKRARCRRKLARKSARKRPLFPRAGGAPRAVLIEVQRALSTSAPTAPVLHRRRAIRLRARSCSRSRTPG